MASKVALIILDGFGLNAETEGNAIAQATLPTVTELLAKYPSWSILASGAAVGLPDRTSGTSEAGHLALGTGQIMTNPLQQTLVDIRSGAFFNNEAARKAFSAAKAKSKKVHLVGLVSDVNVHAASDILYALIEMAKREGYPNKLYIHAILDGRDTGERSGQALLERLYVYLRDQGYGSIATLIGRFYAMDRDGRWDLIEKAFNLMVKGEGETAGTPLTAIADAYGRGQTDEFLTPTVIDKSGLIENGDSVILFNQRSDRTRELAEKFSAAGWSDSYLLAYTNYYQPFPLNVMYQQTVIEPNLVSTVTAAGKSVLKLTETERYAHLTYFFDGRKEDPYPNEERSFVPTPREAEVTKRPELGLRELTKRTVSQLKEEKKDLIIVNLPNADVLGHTGNLAATTEAVEALDVALKQIIPAAGDDYTVVITADHGNAEYLLDRATHEIRKEDTTSPVPLILVHPSLERPYKKTYQTLASEPPAAMLSDVTATVLDLLGVAKPPAMTGLSLRPVSSDS